MIPSRDLRKHAEEARVIADQIQDPEIRVKMLGLADDLDRYAARREAQELGEDAKG